MQYGFFIFLFHSLRQILQPAYMHTISRLGKVMLLDPVQTIAIRADHVCEFCLHKIYSPKSLLDASLVVRITGVRIGMMATWVIKVLPL